MRPSATGRIRLYPGHPEARPEHLIEQILCGMCHAPVLPHGSLCFYDTHSAVQTEGVGCFVLVKDPDQAECGGLSTKYLKRAADGSLELRSNVGRMKLTARHTVVGTLVMVYLVDPAGAGEIDRELRALAGQALAREKAGQAQRFNDAAMSRWGKPPASATATIGAAAP